MVDCSGLRENMRARTHTLNTIHVRTVPTLIVERLEQASPPVSREYDIVLDDPHAFGRVAPVVVVPPGPRVHLIVLADSAGAHFRFDLDGRKRLFEAVEPTY